MVGGGTASVIRAVRQDLEWWADNIENCSAPIFRKNPGPTIHMDAYRAGWGCFYQGRFANGHFSEIEKKFSINTKETLACLYGVRSFISEFTDSTVLILSDSTTAISYVRHMGGMNSELRSKIVTDLWNLCSQHNCWFQISHIPGIDNIFSDWASRHLPDNLEWSLNKSVFKKMCKHLAVSPVIDLTATRINSKCERFYSFGPDPYSEHVDCFTIAWNKVSCYYLFPPFNLLNRCLAKICRDRTKKVLVVFPDWPNQPWYSMMLKMSLHSPLSIQKEDNLLTLPWNSDILHPNLKCLSLHSVVLSGIDSPQRDSTQLQ